MKRELTFVVPSRLDGALLRDVMKREIGISSKQLARMKQHTGAILCNGEPVYVIHRVCTGDELRFLIEDDSEADGIVATQGEVDIRFENSDILIVEKPAGLAVHPAPGDREHTLGNFVVWHYEQLGEQFTYRPVNRLDRGTSGLMVIAKNAYAHASLAREMHTARFEREYLAVTEGVPIQIEGTVCAPIARAEGSTIRREVSKSGADAVTHYRVEETFGGRALVRLRLETGRTHQIRVHMAHLSCPLVGDFLYGQESEEIPRCALHSAKLKLILPVTGDTLEVESDLPQDMANLLKRNEIE
ncbi:MAG: RluA family pseudouridine synthase [Ruminococcaceae bacterium]|nr:RluA family pseudouridine synthase [Oscillospiraceae bacterium]